MEDERCRETLCVSGCTMDEDCGEVLACTDGACLPGTCETDEECRALTYCDPDGICSRGCRVGGCAEGEVCDPEIRECREGCPSDDACTEEEYCQPELLVCAEGCRVDACPEEERCDLDERRCVTGDCLGDEDCPDDRFCRDQFDCVEGCRTDEQCTPQQICTADEHTCVEGCRGDDGGDANCDDVVGAPSQLPYNQTINVNSRICLGDSDHTAVALNAGDTLRVVITPIGEPATLSLVLLSRCDEVVAEGEADGNDVAFSAEIGGTGVYVIRVQGTSPEVTTGYSAGLRRENQ
jgi:hypothetical protein